jgi:prepilin-type N-terminal cleavage/methylation domain-containing protein
MKLGIRIAHNHRGLTLVEVIIVASIIVFLAMMVLVLFRDQIFKGQDARRKADLKKLQTAIEEYEKDHDCYPPASVITCNPGDGLKPYLEKIPCDPETGNDYPYTLAGQTCPDWYKLFAFLENGGTGSSFGPDGDYNYYVSSPNAPGGGLIEEPGYYGCKSGWCTSLFSRLECSPNFTNSNCGGRCGTPSRPRNECQ